MAIGAAQGPLGGCHLVMNAEYILVSTNPCFPEKLRPARLIPSAIALDQSKWAQ